MDHANDHQDVHNQALRYHFEGARVVAVPMHCDQLDNPQKNVLVVLVVPKGVNARINGMNGEHKQQCSANLKPCNGPRPLSLADTAEADQLSLCSAQS